MLPLGAIKLNTCEYVYPRIANKIDKYECPECHRELILRQGNIRIHHFAHCKQDDPCNYYTKPTESQIHKNAKMLLKQLLENKKPIVFIRTCRCCNKDEEYEIPEIDMKSKIEIEYRFEYNGLKIADVAYTDENEIVCLFEIYHTHKTKNENRPEPWFEIKASSLIYYVNTNNESVVKIHCIRSELCEECIEKNKCKEIGPQWYFDCRDGLCVNCDMGVEPLRIIMLDVPFSEKNNAKRLGAKFVYSPYKKWCIKSNHRNKDEILSQFKEWKCPY